MKKISLLLVAALMFCVAGTAVAGSGSAVIPHHQSSASDEDWRATYFYITNITDSTTNVVVTLYDYNGNVLQDGDDKWNEGVLQSSDNVMNWDDNPIGASASFDLADKATCLLRIGFTSEKFGIGKIAWFNPESDTVSLMATGYTYRYHDESSGLHASRFSINVNNSNPF